MTLRPSTIQAGNVSLRSFEESGVHTHASGIESFYRLGYNGFVPPQREVRFRVNNPILLKTLWLLSTNNFSQNDEIYISLSSDVSNYSYTLTLPVQQIAITTSVAVWKPPEFILEPDVQLTFQANFDVGQFSFLGTPCNMYPLILGQLG